MAFHSLAKLHNPVAYIAGSCIPEFLAYSFAAAHEEIERLERLIVKDFKNDVKGHREKLAQGHRVRKMLDEIQAQSQRLVRCCTAPLRTSGTAECK